LTNIVVSISPLRASEAKSVLVNDQSAIVGNYQTETQEHGIVYRGYQLRRKSSRGRTSAEIRVVMAALFDLAHRHDGGPPAV
jgi:hypothetical protein